MTSDLDTKRETPTERRRRRTFRVRVWIGTGCYLLASLALYQWGHGDNPWRIVWALLPVAFMLWIVVVTVLRVRQMDEYQVKLFFPGLAVGFTVSVFSALTLGTLSSAGYDVPNAGWPVALLGIVAWEFTNLLVKAPVA
ncbi:hypothetical protein HII28_19210 [Planctomonas sp. JC2975]|uniref:hypothetical protein n=1 Tax=Planctomonas sp. JC2975 TaxID=2729626 RepID=UPI0014762B26|nr:hypothetical protein [Planctomonas sp. JC2975]NNC13996.1 hypothetical protein [Planctomonas sp. JC2975]